MLANFVIIAFVAGFVALVAYGHVLLITAIWPNLFRRREPGSNGAAEAPNGLPQAKQS